MSNKLGWDSNEMAYFGECSDGAIVRVEGDEWSESIAEGINAEIDERGIDRESLSIEEDDALVEEIRGIVENELDDADWWATLAGDNPNVTMVGNSHA